MATNGHHENLNSASVRWSAYITHADKQGWKVKVDRASARDGIRNPDNGTYLARLIRSPLEFDEASIRKYLRTDKRRGRGPARTRVGSATE